MLPANTELIIKAKKEIILENLNNLHPVEVLFQVFGENLLEDVVQETVKYAHQKKRSNFPFSNPMLKRFIGFLLYTGMHLFQKKIILISCRGCKLPTNT